MVLGEEKLSKKTAQLPLFASLLAQTVQFFQPQSNLYTMSYGIAVQDKDKRLLSAAKTPRHTELRGKTWPLQLSTKRKYLSSLLISKQANYQSHWVSGLGKGSLLERKEGNHDATVGNITIFDMFTPSQSFTLTILRDPCADRV